MPVVQFFSVELGDRPPLHTLLYRLIDIFVPPEVWDRLPNWNLERKGLIVEITLFAILLVGIRALKNPTTATSSFARSLRLCAILRERHKE